MKISDLQTTPKTHGLQRLFLTKIMVGMRKVTFFMPPAANAMKAQDKRQVRSPKKWHSSTIDAVNVQP